MPTGIKNVTLEMILFYWSMLVMLRAVMETPGKYSAFGLRLDSEEDIEFCRSLGLLKKKSVFKTVLARQHILDTCKILLLVSFPSFLLRV